MERARLRGQLMASVTANTTCEVNECDCGAEESRRVVITVMVVLRSTWRWCDCGARSRLGINM